MKYIPKRLTRVRRQNRLLLSLLAWTAIVIITIAMDGPIYDIYRSIRYDYTDRYSGEIVSVEAQGKTMRSCGKIDIRYRYSVGNQVFYSDDVWNTSTCIEKMKPFMHLKEGDKVTVFVDKNHFDQSVLNARSPSAWQYFIAAIILFLPVVFFR